MKKICLSLVCTGILLLASQETQAQVILPAASSTTKIEQGIGIKTIRLTYQRPNRNGRTIFGELVPYGEVWRTGANNCTRISFEEAVNIAGHEVPAGTYGLFSIPRKGEWTIILSKNADQWGAYSYKESEDILRFQASSRQLTEPVETLTIAFEDVKPSSTQVTLSWEHTSVSFPITVDQTEEIQTNISKAMKGEKKPYFAAAQYYYNNGLDINKAASWIKTADEGNTTAPHIKYWKARILLKASDKAGAIKAATEGVAMAAAAGNNEYVKLNKQVINDAKTQ